MYPVHLLSAQRLFRLERNSMFPGLSSTRHVTPSVDAASRAPGSLDIYILRLLPGFPPPGTCIPNRPVTKGTAAFRNINDKIIILKVTLNSTKVPLIFVTIGNTVRATGIVLCKLI